MTLSIEKRTFSRSDFGLLLLTLYCLAVLSFFLIGSGAVWLRSWGPAKLRPFSIPAPAMSPTLNDGDYVLGAMYAWQEPQLQRGDIVFFSRNDIGPAIWIKRIVGLPGDRVQMISGRLHINGNAVPRRQIDDFTIKDPYRGKAHVPQYEEIFAEGRGHLLIETKGDQGYWDNTKAVTVPEGEVFVMGDNRDDSSDSRDADLLGTVPITRILGHPIFIVWSNDWSRIGSVPN